MKVELHCHTSRYSGCGRNTPAELMERMIQLGYDAVYITEHDKVWPVDELAQLTHQFPGIRIFPGVELSLGPLSRVHLLVLGASDPAYTALKDIRSILDKARADGHMTILAHPYRWLVRATMLAKGFLPDAVEHLTGNHDARQGRKSAAASKRHKLPMVNAGDTHGFDMLNRFWIETREPVHTADDIRRIVQAGAYDNCVGDK